MAQILDSTIGLLSLRVFRSPSSSNSCLSSSNNSSNMGNNPSGRGGGREEDSDNARYSVSHGGGTSYQGSKKKPIVQPVKEGQGEDTITKILNQTSMVDVHSQRNRMSTSFSESATALADKAGAGNAGMHKLGSVNAAGEVMKPTLPTVFKWEGGGKEVYISGTFNGWKAKIPMVKSHQNFYTIVDLPEGEHRYKFIVDGQWKIDTHQPSLSDTSDPTNVIVVKPSDFDVLEALSHDVANSKSSTTGSTSGTQPQQHSASAGPPSRRHRTHSVDSNGGETPSKPVPVGREVATPKTAARYGSGNALSGSPPGEYGQEEPPRPQQPQQATSGTSSSGGNKVLTPPLLPPQLLQVILNKTTGAQCDPNLLPHPNHVMVNHMYALSIKDGVIVLSAITRYRKKFVSTVIYKPI